ncbi:uncharacterized protein LOC143246482 [Tachypleus tridentatus]|uniref:uncharacterized protein LOC143246482 n=1 Tax=Tachypleus tridentatus TaxID=6853 RepID=UPI003FCFDD1A
MVARYFFLLFDCLLCCSTSHAHIWSLVLDNPIPGDSFKSGSSIPWNTSTDMENGKEVASHVLIPCHGHIKCPEGWFCDYNKGYCDIYRKAKEPCENDYQCHSNLICIRAKCTRPYEPRYKGWSFNVVFGQNSST